MLDEEVWLQGRKLFRFEGTKEKSHYDWMKEMICHITTNVLETVQRINSLINKRK